MTVRIAVIGLGFMGRTHARAFARAASLGRDCRVVAVADPHARKILSGASPADGGNIATGDALPFGENDVRVYEEGEDALADDGVDLACVCTYTDTHAPLASLALRAGKHVLVEKPVALTAAGVCPLLEAARASPRLACIPAMCMRYWPGWDVLRDRVRDGSLGELRSLTLTRLGSGPAWGRRFYDDHARSGGAFIDLHIHDADFVVHALGMPRAVSSTGTTSHVTTLYQFGSVGPGHVVAEGAWDLAPGAGFRMRYLAAFEHATLEWDLSRSPRLIRHDASGSHEIALADHSGYEAQALHVIDVIEGHAAPLATMEDAWNVARVLDAERESLARNGERVAIYS